MMRAWAKIAALLLATVMGAAAQQTTTPSGTSSSKQKPATPQPSPSTSKPGTVKRNTQTGTAKPKTPTGATKPSLSANWKKYCAPEGDYCVKYPTTWEPLGDSADSGGLVIAPPQPKKPSAQWSSVTIAATDLPQPTAGKERPKFDELIGLVLESMRPGVNQQTLERRQLEVDDLPAQFLKLKYVDEGRTWIEEIVLIDGEDVVYSMALRCTPEEAPSFEPIFKEIVGTWKAVESNE
jgi:hypothetical protein